MNKVILLALLILIPVCPEAGFSQIIENFETGSVSEWIQSPGNRWKAENSDAISGSFSLHHSFDNPDAGNDIIGIQLKNLRPGDSSAAWTFRIRYGYDPSSSNNWAVYIMSDSDPSVIQTGNTVNGFVAGVNLTGYDDTLRLWKIKNGLPVPLITSKVNWQTMVGPSAQALIKIIRSQQGNWSLSVFRADNTLLDECSGYDPELFDPGWFAIAYRYTSTRDMLLWIDDVSIDGVFREDKKPPEIISCKAEGRNTLLVSFSEKLSEESAQPSNFTVTNGENRAIETIQESSVSLRIIFSGEFKNKSENSLMVNKLCDISGNCTGNISVKFVPAWTGPGDVVITEIMADPLPAVSLPGKEYLEIFNRSAYTLDLKNWKIATASQSYPGPDITMLPGDYLILCSASDTSLVRNYGRIAGFRTFPALTDQGREIALTDSSGTLINGVKYSSRWYGDELKSNGGWSLEIIDTEFPFYGEGNWKASAAPEGGTPGRANSIRDENPDNYFYGIENAFPDDSNKLRLKLSETVAGLSEMTGHIKTDGNEIKRITPSGLLCNEFMLEPASSFQRGHIYKLEADDNIRDFAGNPMMRKRISFGIPEKAQKGDVQFNELLFNPLPGAPDYIEFVNCSQNVVDLSELFVVAVNDETSDTSGIVNLSGEGRCLNPGDYYVITTDRKKLTEGSFLSDYDNIYEIPSMPSMPDDKGHLLLYSRKLTLVDEVKYNENMHNSLLREPEGVAVEKIRPGYSSLDPDYWHSASEASGWGTPGNVNSVFCEETDSEDQLRFSSARITPDNDGHEDFLVIDVRLKGNGNVISAEVFGETGNFVKKVADNLLAGDEASIVWDATASDGKIVDTGIYVFLIQVFDDNGKLRRWKKVCTVIR